MGTSQLRKDDGPVEWFSVVVPARNEADRIAPLLSAPADAPDVAEAIVSLGEVSGLRAVVGVGEVPFVRLGTVAVWDDDRSAPGPGGPYTWPRSKPRAVSVGGDVVGLESGGLRRPSLTPLSRTTRARRRSTALG